MHMRRITHYSVINVYVYIVVRRPPSITKFDNNNGTVTVYQRDAEVTIKCEAVGNPTPV